MRFYISAIIAGVLCVAVDVRADNQTTSGRGRLSLSGNGSAAAKKEAAGAGGSRLASPRLTAGLRKKEDKPEILGIYVAGFGGYNFMGESDLDYETDIVPGQLTFTGDGDGGQGWLAGMKIGYSLFNREKALDEFQLLPTIELESAYMSLSQDLDGSERGSGTNIQADLEIVTVTANALLKARNKYVTPYAGLGGGLGYVKISDASGKIDTNPGGDKVKGLDGDEESQYVPVLLGIFGLERDVYKANLTLFMEYKALYIPDADFDVGGKSGSTTKVEFSNMLNQSIQSGVRWTF